jgi:hypothetical protein
MVVLTKTPEYTHTQTAPLCLILYGSALGCFIFGWWIGDMPGMCVASGVGLLLTLLAPAFHHLTVADHADGLAIQFGPTPLFRRTVNYIEIEKVEVGRTLIVDGWGIHFSIRGGWVWNLWGGIVSSSISRQELCCGSAPMTLRTLRHF